MHTKPDTKDTDMSESLHVCEEELRYACSPLPLSVHAGLSKMQGALAQTLASSPRRHSSRQAHMRASNP